MIYTLEDINNKLISPIESDYGDIMDSSLECYSYLMDYLERRNISYKIYEYKHKYDAYKEEYHCYLEIVLEEYLDEFLSNMDDTCKKYDYLIYLSCDMNRTKINSRLNSFLCARKWEKDVKEEFNKNYPDYHLNINVNYVSEDYAPDEVFLIKGRYDYHKFYKYISKDRRDFFDRLFEEKYIPESSVNVILSDKISEEEMDKIYKGMKSFFKKYHINTVYFIRPDEAERAKILKEERIANNNYTYESQPIPMSSDITEEFQVVKKYDVKKKPKSKYGYESKKDNKPKKSIKVPKVAKKVLFIISFPLIIIWIVYLLVKILKRLDDN